MAELRARHVMNRRVTAATPRLEWSKMEDVVPRVFGPIDHLPPLEPPLKSGERSRVP